MLPTMSFLTGVNAIEPNTSAKLLGYRVVIEGLIE